VASKKATRKKSSAKKPATRKKKPTPAKDVRRKKPATPKKTASPKGKGKREPAPKKAATPTKKAATKKAASPKKAAAPKKPAAPKKTAAKKVAPPKKKPSRIELERAARELKEIKRKAKQKRARQNKRKQELRDQIRDLGYGPGVIPIGFRPGHAPNLRTREERDEALKNGRARLRMVVTRVEQHMIDDGYDVDGRAAQRRKKFVAAAVALSITSPGERYVTRIVFNSLETAIARTLREVPQDILFERLYVQFSAVYDANESAPAGLKRYTWDEPSRTLYTGVHSLRNYGDAISTLEALAGRSHPKAIKMTLSFIH